MENQLDETMAYEMETGFMLTFIGSGVSGYEGSFSVCSRNKDCGIYVSGFRV